MAFLSTSQADTLQRLRSGQLAVLPTETVYGLAADACNEAAVQAVFQLKGRPAHNPLIVHVSSIDMARRYVQWNDVAQSLAQQYWPGPLTLVLPALAGSQVTPAVRAGGQTIAVRCPAHPLARAVIEGFDGAIAAPSANRSGRISPTQSAHVLAEFPDADLLVLDGGPCQIGLESTVVDCTGACAMLLRPGSVLLSSGEQASAAHHDETLKSPGLLTSHYAPNAPVRLNASAVSADEALLAFGNPLQGAGKMLNLSPNGNLEEAARNLFAMLRALDLPDVRAIAVMPIAPDGIGAAINDRLKRAAAR